MQILKTLENSSLQWTLIDESSSNTSKPTLKANTTQGPTSSIARYTTQILQQHRKHSPELQYTGSPKSLQTHWHFITHYWTLIWTSERRNTDPHPRTPTQASLTKKLWQATCTTPPTEKLHNKENSTNCQNTERTPQTQQYKQDEETEEYPAGKGAG